MRTQTTGSILASTVPVGSDFAGGAEPLPVRPADAGQVVPGTDFAGGEVPLTAEVAPWVPDEAPAAC